MTKRIMRNKPKPLTCPKCGKSGHPGGMGYHIARDACRPGALEELFWSKVDKTTSERGCWLWTSYTNEKGYGLIQVPGNKNYRAHRFSWELVHGKTPSHRFCLHKCDTPRCVNPEHLFIGSYQENASDSKAKGRNVRGEKNSHAILTEALVLELRREFTWVTPKRSNAKELGERYGLRDGTVYMAATGRTWKHLPMPSRSGCEPRE